MLAYLLAMQLAAHIAAPFFTPYMLGPLELDYQRFTALIASSFLARIAILPVLGRLAQQRGSRFVLVAGAIGIIPLPALWLVSDQFAYLLALQLVSGCAWAAVEYASLLSFFEGIDERDRASVLSLFNLANAAALTGGSVIGGLLLRRARRRRRLLCLAVRDLEPGAARDPAAAARRTADPRADPHADAAHRAAHRGRASGIGRGAASDPDERPGARARVRAGAALRRCRRGPLS